MNCKVCNSEIPQDAVFCPVCGAAVNPQPEANAGTKFCPICGTAYGPEMHNCPGCGAPVNQPNASAGYSQQGTYQNPNYSQQNQYQQPGYGRQNPYMNGNPYVNGGVKRKSKVAAALFAFFLGGLGIHNFYLGYTNKAVIQLVLGLLSCGLISEIWALVEGILILTDNISTDANGVPLE